MTHVELLVDLELSSGNLLDPKCEQAFKRAGSLLRMLGKLDKISEWTHGRTLTAGDKTVNAYSLRSIGIPSLAGFTARPVFADKGTPEVLEKQLASLTITGSWKNSFYSPLEKTTRVIPSSKPRRQKGDDTR